MIFPLLASIIIDRCLCYLLDPISSILEISTKYNLHPGQFIKRISIRNLGTDGGTVITFTNVTYIGIDSEGYILAITADSRFTSTSRLASEYYADYAMNEIRKDVDGKMKVVQDGKKITIPSVQLSTEDATIGIGFGEITYLEL